MLFLLTRGKSKGNVLPISSCTFLINGTLLSYRSLEIKIFHLKFNLDMYPKNVA